MEFNILCGIPGSGKSTLVSLLPGYVVSTDRIRKFLWQDESIVKHDALVFSLVDSILNYMLKKKENVVLDATNLTKKTRKHYIKLGKKYQATVILHWIECPLDLALTRNFQRERRVPEEVILSLYHSFQEPHITEGMDLIKIYDINLEIKNTIAGQKEI
ncbi:MAG: AAA family ATPase [Bacillota bacterium]